MTQPNVCMIGAYAGGIGGMVTLSSLLEGMGIPYEPDIKYQNFSAFQDMEDSSRRGLGYPFVTLKWQALSDVQRYALRTYCSALSSQIYIRVSTNETSSAGIHIWHTFLCTLLWVTDAEDREAWITDIQAGYMLDVKLICRALVQQD